MRLGLPEGDLPPKPRRSRGAPLLAADRGRAQPACRRPALVHDDVRPRQHLHEPAGSPVRARAGGDHATALGEWQGNGVDDFRDEDPGRILHEMRYGEMTAFEERPHSPYYGCADATPLYVVLLDEYERWTGDRKLVRALEYEARKALAWIDDYADLQGDGYIWYSAATRRPASRTSAGRTRGTPSPTGTASSPAFPGPRASYRDTRTTRRCAARGSRGSSGRTPSSPTRSRSRPPT